MRIENKGVFVCGGGAWGGETWKKVGGGREKLNERSVTKGEMDG